MADFKPACHTSSILTYTPVYGDYLIWSRWFSTWHGFLVDYRLPNECTFIFAGLPIFLVNPNGAGKSIKRLDLDTIRNSKGGQFAIIRHSNDYSFPIWFV